MIGGIGVFLPFCPGGGRSLCCRWCSNSRRTVSCDCQERRGIGADFGSCPSRAEEENEHSEECLNTFSQEAEEAVALKLTAEEAEEDDEHSEEWLNIFSQEAEKTATWEFAAEEEEEADNICFADLWEQIEALEERVKVQSVHIQQVKLELMKEAWEIMMICSCAKNFCS
jgi:hypothetical protein